MVEEVRASGERCLVFTQFVETGELLRRALEDALDEPVLFLHGGVRPRDRDRMVETFQDPASRAGVFLLSLRAGGVGLNLTAATHVFHFDRWWNPAVENQATDRAYRIGQHRHVQVHKFITLGTLEERIDQLIERKLALGEQIIGTGEQWITELSTEELRDLFALRRSWVNE
ncbi:C-terminal helicase domain-containing protein [Alicyclobacillus macrosporangiidus]|uniref:DEAD/DEAH box helicase n=1 Tax=Alicyclobacillus macrosporangiidus TaxID=392015 RepID=UPI001E65361A|nr:C-terminal helicase domain-containing protein [Alicyclobacillus macrosporangiidus]